MRKALRWLKRIVLGSLALAVIAIGVTLVVIHTDWGRERIRRRVEATLLAEFPGGASVGRIDGSIFSALVITDVKLAALDGKPLASVGKLTVDIALLPLVSKTIRIEHVVAEGLEIVDPQRPFAPTRPTEPADDKAASEAWAWSVELPHLELREASFQVAGRERITLADLSLRANVRLPAGHPLEAQLESLRGRWVERDATFDVAARAQLGVVPTVSSLVVKLGGVVVTGTDLVGDPAAPSGTLVIEAPGRAIAALAPELAWVGDSKLAVSASHAGSKALVEIRGNVGANRVTALVHGAFDPATLAGGGDAVVFAEGRDLAALSQGAVRGEGALLAVLRGDRTGVRGLVHASTRLAARPAVVATLAIDTLLQPSPSACEIPLARASSQLLVAGEGGLRAAAAGSVVANGCAITIVDDAQLTAAVQDVGRATGGLAEGRGNLAVTATARGALTPAPALAIAATLTGTRVRQQALSIGTTNGTIAATLRGDVLDATLEATAAGISNAGQPVGRGVLHASTRLVIGGAAPTIAVRATAWPALAGASRVDLAATVQLPAGAASPTTIELGTHAVVLANGAAWRGRGGTIRIGPAGEPMTIAGFRTASGTGSVALDARYGVTGNVEAKLEATTIPASLIDPRYRGSASGKVVLRQRGIRWDGTAMFTMRGFATGEHVTPVDADLAMKVAGRQVSVDASTRTSRLGKVQFVLDVEGPRDLLDVEAWQRLDRKAIRTASLAVDRVDLAALDVPSGGILDGRFTLISGLATTDKNELRVQGVMTPVGAASGTLVFAQQANDELGAAGNAHIEGVGDANLTAHFKFPDRPFDPLAWKQLGRGVVRELVLVIDDVVIDPGKLAQLGFHDAPYHGRADLQIGIHPGVSQAEIQVDLHELRGEPLVKPLDLEIRARSDASGTTGKVTLIDPSVEAQPQGLTAASAGAHRDLVILEGSTPVTFDRWLNDPIPLLMNAPVRGRFAIPRLEMRRLLAYFGRLQSMKGTFAGNLDIKGTIGVPTVSGELVANDIEGPPGIEGGRPPRLDELKLAVEWGGVAGRIVLTGEEASGRLYATVLGQPTKLETIFASVKLTGFDLAPLAALMPGAFAATTGVLDGNISMNKFDPVTMKGLAVGLRLTRGRIPLIPILGTLHETDARIDYGDAGLVLRVEGPEQDKLLNRYAAKLGQTGRVWVRVTAPRDLSTLDGRLEMRDVQMIGEVEPIITGIATAKLVRQGMRLVGRIDVTNMSAIVPEETGQDLLDPDAPTDLYIVEDGVKLDRKPMFALGARAPDDPFVVVDVNIAPTKLEALSILDDFGVRAQISGNLKVSLGDTLGVLGRIGIDRGTVDVLGRIYKVDPASELVFDGTTDGRLGIDLSHDFPSMTLFVMLRGRLANPDPQFASDPAIYSQGQLAGFLAGGDPGGDTAAQTREAATGTGAALLSTRLGKRLKRVLPVKLDLIRCDPGSSAAGASCTIGRWLSDSVFLAFKSRLEARPDENSGDLQLQWYFRREWLIEGVGGDRNHNGVDLLWRRRW